MLWLREVINYSFQRDECAEEALRLLKYHEEGQQLAGVLADTVEVPPLNVSSVRTSWQELREQAEDLPDAADLERIFAELRLAARQEDRSVLEVSSMVALSAVRSGVKLGSVYVFDHYRRALRTIVEEGLLTFLRRTSTS